MARLAAGIPYARVVPATGSQGRIAPGRQAKASFPAKRSAHTKWDLVLSSGFLSFASHAGFLQAVEQADLNVGAIMGTSAGALAGSLYCAGFSAEQVAAELSRVPPLELLVPCRQPWQGLLSLERVVDRLQALLPPTFEELPQQFAVGVVTRQGQHMLIDSGPLPEAVAASAAIPFIFGPVAIPGRVQGPFQDGGVADRIGLDIWTRQRRLEGSSPADTPALVHLIARSSPFSGTELLEVGADVVVHALLPNSPIYGIQTQSRDRAVSDGQGEESS
ncbi:hypothetical protein WJX84_006542 [Apatococcus fuscideae]|uniref:Patatin n=1 Tax=Apatococcus fuscideae TaxID=2026836 RepID=A0AAW1TKA9_9CHLO